MEEGIVHVFLGVIEIHHGVRVLAVTAQVQVLLIVTLDLRVPGLRREGLMHIQDGLGVAALLEQRC